MSKPKLSNPDPDPRVELSKAPLHTPNLQHLRRQGKLLCCTLTNTSVGQTFSFSDSQAKRCGAHRLENYSAPVPDSKYPFLRAKGELKWGSETYDTCTRGLATTNEEWTCFLQRHCHCWGSWKRRHSFARNGFAILLIEQRADRNRVCDVSNAHVCELCRNITLAFLAANTCSEMAAPNLHGGLNRNCLLASNVPSILRRKQHLKLRNICTCCGVSECCS